eukprot:4668936-Amphidinium_carterae.1
MPWEDILESLQHVVDIGDSMGRKVEPSISHTGSDLAEIVRVILKTNKETRTIADEVKTFTHQANDGPTFVEKLLSRAMRIFEMKGYGHFAYTIVDEDTKMECHHRRNFKETTPLDGMQHEASLAGEAFGVERPKAPSGKAVVAEGEDSRDAEIVSATA